MSVQLFVDTERLQSGRLELSGDEHHYLCHVRRLSAGDNVVLLDGQGRRAHAEIQALNAGSSVVLVSEPEEVPKPEFFLEVAIALLKGDHMDQAVTKMVELGVARIRPMVTERTIVRLKGDRRRQKLQRFESLATAAARQSQNPHPTEIVSIESLTSLLKAPIEAEIKLIPDVGTGSSSLSKVLKSFSSRRPRSAFVLIGPEGGFSAAEVSAAKDAKFIPTRLGPRVLRAETACLAIASILSFRYGDVGS